MTGVVGVAAAFCGSAGCCGCRLLRRGVFHIVAGLLLRLARAGGWTQRGCSVICGVMQRVD